MRAMVIPTGVRRRSIPISGWWAIPRSGIVAVVAIVTIIAVVAWRRTIAASCRRISGFICHGKFVYSADVSPISLLRGCWMDWELSQVEDAAIFFVLGFQERQHPARAATDGDWAALCCPWTSAARITAISGGSDQGRQLHGFRDQSSGTQDQRVADKWRVIYFLMRKFMAIRPHCTKQGATGIGSIPRCF